MRLRPIQRVLLSLAGVAAIVYGIHLIQTGHAKHRLEQQAAVWATRQFKANGIHYAKLDCTDVKQTSPPVVDCDAIFGSYHAADVPKHPTTTQIADGGSAKDPRCLYDPSQTFTGGPPDQFVPPCHYLGHRFGKVAVL